METLRGYRFTETVPFRFTAERFQKALEEIHVQFITGDFYDRTGIEA